MVQWYFVHVLPDQFHFQNIALYCLQCSNVLLFCAKTVPCLEKASQ